MSHKTKDGWLRCDGKRHKCPVCQKDWCTVSPDGKLACCMRAESDWPVKNGGWMHRLTDDAPRRGDGTYHHRPAEYHEPEPASLIDFMGMMERWTRLTSAAALCRHAFELGVSSDSLSRLNVAYASTHKAWAFPMYGTDARITGIRLRSEAGDKWAVKGSRQGIFWPKGEASDPTCVCEGPTDTAAMLDLGFFAIGRPSCSGCVDQLVEMLRGHDVWIMGDRDSPRTRPDGTTWLPGKEGAERLADALVLGRARSVKIVYPLRDCKDVRAWLRAGATHEIVMTAARQRSYWQPKS